ncbi:SPDY domain-containing protein [Streptomyces nigrescens]|uniref:DUF317 domain-containing protein n=1 Tax=Streptomyces nigrescens TaxID=1920 RepID=UPI0022536B73|nr:DUF317 domain-containing protein [Streptomyces libani]MCX5449858.1 DUF317 domain-containing protein [Streptomyces libani]
MSARDAYDPHLFQEVLVSPMYLAGPDGTGDAGFAPVAHWPHHHLEDGPCQLVVASPDQRIRIGWFGDDFELWKITAAEDAVSTPRWTATFNHVTPPEIVAGLTTALAHDYAEADAYDINARFLASPSPYWTDAIRPLTDAGWTRDAAERGTVEYSSPDDQAGVLIDNRRSGWDAKTVELWAGPPSWGTRAEAVFTARTPSHLIAATASAMADSAPVIRERHQIDREMESLVTLTPIGSTAPQVPRPPTPLDVRRTAVAQAVHRAARAPRSAADLRVMAARSRTATSTRTGAHTPVTAAVARPLLSPSAPRRGR